MKKTIYEITEEHAISDAKRVINEEHTVYLFCLKKLISLKRVDKDGNLDYFRHGRECYHLYTEKLLELVRAYYASRGITGSHSIPSWDDDALVSYYTAN